MEDEKIKFENKTTTLFDRVASHYDSYFSRLYFEPLYTKILKTIEKEKLILPQARVLDVACGTGEVISRLVKKYPESYFVGIDASPQMITEAKKKTEDTANSSFVIGGVEAMPFEKESFDLVISSEAFHHFWNPEAVLQEIHRVLKPEGVLFLIDPGADTFFQKIFFRQLGSFLEVHKHIYTESELRNLLEEQGFIMLSFFRYWMNNHVIAKKFSLV